VLGVRPGCTPAARCALRPARAEAIDGQVSTTWQAKDLPVWKDKANGSSPGLNARGLTSLGSFATSKSGRSGVAVERTPNPNLVAINVSFANLLSHAPKTVLAWISRGDPTENKIRLSCAMGVLALWSSDTGEILLDGSANDEG
jgi:hypothetical protein